MLLPNRNGHEPSMLGYIRRIMKETESQTEPGCAARLDILDAGAEEGARDLEQRSEPRRSLRSECEVFLFHPCGASATSVSGVARNRSFHGFSFVSGLATPVQPGRPVEVVVEAPDEPRTHLAGTVAFCRQVDEACYELGIHVEAAGRGPIVMHNIQRAQQMYEWFSHALDVPE